MIASVLPHLVLIERDLSGLEVPKNITVIIFFAPAPPGPSAQRDSWLSTAPLRNFSASASWPASQPPTPSSGD